MGLLKRKCQHDYEIIGTFYKEHFTEYTNCFDTIDVYRKERCKKCNHIKNTLLSSESFMPQLHEGREERKDKYIKFLREFKDIKLEIEL